MSKIKTTLFLVLLLAFMHEAQAQTVIPFEVSDYGLIFTEVTVNSQPVKAMIDFDQPHMLMLSSSLVAKYQIETRKSERVGYDLNGEELVFYEGKTNELLVQDLSIKSAPFSSSPNEMEAVSKQIGTRFDAALGWGFFSKYYFTLDYKGRKITLHQKVQKLEKSFEVPYDKNGSYMMLNTQLGKKKARLLIDTGAPVSSLHDGFLKGEKSQKNRYGQPVLLLDTELGSEHLDIEYELRDLSVLESLKVVGILGGDLLEKYVISIDPENQVMYWQPVG